MTPGLEEQTEEDIKPECEPYYPANRTNSRELSRIIDVPLESASESATEIDLDDCLIVGETSVFPTPFPSTNEGLVKRETDIISNDKPFNETVSFEIFTVFMLLKNLF